jgi:hypothetical protein
VVRRKVVGCAMACGGSAMTCALPDGGVGEVAWPSGRGAVT